MTTMRSAARRRGARLFRQAGFDVHPWHIDDSLEYSDRGRTVGCLLREYASWAASGCAR